MYNKYFIVSRLSEKYAPDGTQLPLVEEFYTLQGEGYHTGKAAYFIRIGGCDVGCSWCDTKFSWQAELHPLTDTFKIVDNAVPFPAKAVVVTGGEPLSYNLDILCEELKKNNIETFLETSGAYPLSGSWDWICLSPKKNLPPVPEIYSKANELKMIVQKEADFEWAEINRDKVGSNCKLYLQPEWSRYKEIIDPLVEYVKQHPEWQISLQAHKFMHIP
ncbi:MAG TPA: 7-carboxy-7-deazaguanine synthase QueE [Bacteroidales bacterium]|nr:7-carboxy-7-deazaguanine synthase QueE [Bacteroidales bacterium]